MKKTLGIVSGLAMATAVVMLTGCGDKNEQKAADQPSITFDTYSTTSTYSLKGSAKDFGQTADVVCSDGVSLLMPTKLNDADITMLRDSIMELALQNANADVNKAINTWLAAQAKESGYQTEPSDAAPSAAEGFCNVKGYVVNLTPEMLVYCVTTDTYAPHAANGMTYDEYINFALGEGKILSLSDLFTADGLKALPGVIAEQAKEIPAYAGQVDITALPSNNNYYLSSEGQIVFSYAPIEVGPHSLGTVDIPFYPTELVSYMTPEAIQLFGLTDIE